MLNLITSTNSRLWLNYLWVFIFILAIIILSNRLVSQLKTEEEKRVEALAEAYTLLGSDATLDQKTISFLFDFTSKNNSIPLLILDENDAYVQSKNIDSTRINTSQKLKKTINEFKSEYPPIIFELPGEQQYLYYENSRLLNQLEFYPYILIGLILLFVLFTLWYFRTIRRTEQSYLWAGLAKETAHQIGTPLSSIMGWIELLKLDPNDVESLEEMENDVKRLQFITDRFSKIGSKADLKETDLTQSTKEIIQYLKRRISDKIEITLSYDHVPILANINVPLFNWVIENLVKNAVDSLKERGKIAISIREKDKWLEIDISDNGPGISKGHKKNVFKPGFSTKQRGWGLGLSLAKRIIESYHNGKIFVLKSEPMEETTFRIQLKNVSN